MLNIYSARIGAFNNWEKEGELILPPFSYHSEADWIDYLERFFPEKIRKVKDILERKRSTLNGRIDYKFSQDYVVFKLLEFLNKNYKVANKAT